MLLAALYFFMDGADFLALMLAAAAHELGHQVDEHRHVLTHALHLFQLLDGGVKDCIQ